MKAYVIATATLFAVGCSSTQPTHTAGNRNDERSAGQSSPSAQSAFMGPRGADGPAGPSGPQGRAGETGPAGYAMAGPRGADGPAGPEGPTGRAGERGAAGGVVVGPRGEAGATGPAGAAGARGEVGARGESAEGTAGPAGRAGPAGPQGRVGETGERGPQLVGPAGQAGRTGAAGPAGERGEAGTRGETTSGVAGAVGAAGPAGPRGDAGREGERGVTGSFERWIAYREVWFDPNSQDIHDADRPLFEEIASYMRANPSLDLGIDGSTNPRATSRRDIDLGTNRVKAIRESLVNAGVPADRISEGFYGDQNLRRDQKVDLLVRTSPDAANRQRQPDQYQDSQRSQGDQQRSQVDRERQQDSQRSQTDRERQQDSQRSQGDQQRSQVDRQRQQDTQCSQTGQQTQTVRYERSMPAEEDLTERWTAIRTIWFDCDSNSVHKADEMKIEELAAFAKENHSFEIGIDSSVPSSDADQSADSRDVAVRRGNAVRDALVAAGVPASKIKMGSFGDANQRRAGRVEVLLRSNQLAAQTPR